MLFGGVVEKHTINISPLNLIAVIAKSAPSINRFCCIAFSALRVVFRPPIYNKSITVFLCHGAFNRPFTGKYSLEKLLSFNIQFKLFYPLSSSLLPAFIFYKSIVISVIRLLKSCSPFAVFWRVIFVYINTVKGSILEFLFMCKIRARHIIVKSFKGRPFIAERYSSATIKFIIPSFCVYTALSHIHPTKIERTSASQPIPTRISMSSVTSFTATAYRYPIQKIIFSFFAKFSTIAFKKPTLCLSLWCAEVFDSSKFIFFSAYEFLNEFEVWFFVHRYCIIP